MASPEIRAKALGRYILGPRLAVGGMGEIFIAFESGTKNPPLRALKLLLPHLSESREAVQMFLNEAQLTVRMNHPNVVRLFDVGAEDDRYFLVMELVHGMPLSTLVSALKAQKAHVPPTVISYIGRALCDGLHHAHELTLPDGTHLEVIHRDVTPDNILISMSGEVKLSDFGIAKARALDRHTRPGNFKGKYEYAAPEQLRSGPIDRRVDIFGAGLTLYQLSTLTSPFHRETDIATLNAIATEDLPPLLPLRPDLPDHLLEAIAAATQKDVNKRLPTAAALRDALPPFPKDESQQELATLLRKLCTEQLEKLEAKVAQAESLIAAEPAPRRERSSGTKPALKLAKPAGTRTPTPNSSVVPVPPPPTPAIVVPTPAGAAPSAEISAAPDDPSTAEPKTSPQALAAAHLRPRRSVAMLALSIGGALVVGTIAVLFFRPDTPIQETSQRIALTAEPAPPPDSPTPTAPEAPKNPEAAGSLEGNDLSSAGAADNDKQVAANGSASSAAIGVDAGSAVGAPLANSPTAEVYFIF